MALGRLKCPLLFSSSWQTLPVTDQQSSVLAARLICIFSYQVANGMVPGLKNVCSHSEQSGVLGGGPLTARVLRHVTRTATPLVARRWPLPHTRLPSYLTSHVFFIKPLT